MPQQSSRRAAGLGCYPFQQTPRPHQYTYRSKRNQRPPAACRRQHARFQCAIARPRAPAAGKGRTERERSTDERKQKKSQQMMQRLSPRHCTSPIPPPRTHTHTHTHARTHTLARRRTRRARGRGARLWPGAEGALNSSRPPPQQQQQHVALPMITVARGRRPFPPPLLPRRCRSAARTVAAGLRCTSTRRGRRAAKGSRGQRARAQDQAEEVSWRSSGCSPFHRASACRPPLAVPRPRARAMAASRHSAARLTPACGARAARTAAAEAWKWGSRGWSAVCHTPSRHRSQPPVALRSLLLPPLRLSSTLPLLSLSALRIDPLASRRRHTHIHTHTHISGMQK